ncbi:MAG: helix-turn-helix domain-containing protein [Ruminococcaceae bacterium]|nr:helix-turn-helix domain-containing protein [Oscillospiraceae bacterium]
MDLIKIGKFLAELRHEKNLTQEQLGEKLGVTNKTVSRWENGNYMPPVEMLRLLSELYSVSINEILSGEKLSDTEYKEKAEENIKAVLRTSFSLKEKIEFFKEKWKKDHRLSLILWIIVFAAVFASGVLAGWFVREKAWFVVCGVDCIGAAVVRIERYNKMMAYAEQKAFDGSGKQ